MINAWRNISDTAPIYNNTLACADQTTIRSPDDYLRVDVPLTAEATQISAGDLFFPQFRKIVFGVAVLLAKTGFDAAEKQLRQVCCTMRAREPRFGIGFAPARPPPSSTA